MMVQFTTRSGGSLRAFDEPRTMQTHPVPAKVRVARSIAVVIAVLALAVFVGMAGHALRRPGPPIATTARAQSSARPHQTVTAEAHLQSAKSAHRHQS